MSIFSRYPVFVNHETNAVYPGHIVKFFENNSDIPKDIYTDADFSNGINKVTLDSNGRSPQPLYAKGLYTIKIFSSDTSQVPVYIESGIGDLDLERQELDEYNASAYNIFSVPPSVNTGINPSVRATIEDYPASTTNGQFSVDIKLTEGTLDGDLIPGKNFELDTHGLLTIRASTGSSTNPTNYIDESKALNYIVYVKLLDRHIVGQDGEGDEFYASENLSRNLITSQGAKIYSPFSTGSEKFEDFETSSYIISSVPSPSAQSGKASAPLSVWKKGHPYEIIIRLLGEVSNFPAYQDELSFQVRVASFSAILKQYNTNVALTPELRDSVRDAQRYAQDARNAAASAEQAIDRANVPIGGVINAENYVPYIIDYKRSYDNTKNILEISKWAKVSGTDIIVEEGVIPRAFFGTRTLTTHEDFANSYSGAFDVTNARLLVEIPNANPDEDDLENASGRFTLTTEGNVKYVKISETVENSGIPQGYIKQNALVNEEGGTLNAINVGALSVPEIGDQTRVQSQGPTVTPIPTGVVRDVLLTPDIVEGNIAIDTISRTTRRKTNSDPDIIDYKLSVSGNNIENLFTINSDETFTLETTGVHELEVLKEIYDIDHANGNNSWGIVIKKNDVVVTDYWLEENAQDIQTSTRFEGSNSILPFRFGTPQFKANKGDKIAVYFRWRRSGGESIQYASNTEGSIKVKRLINTPASSVDSVANITTRVTKIIGTSIGSNGIVKVSQTGWSFDSNDLDFINDGVTSLTTSDWLEVPETGPYIINTYGFAEASPTREYELKGTFEVSQNPLSTNDEQVKELAGTSVFLKKGYGIRLKSWNSSNLATIKGLTNPRIVIEIAAQRVLQNIFKPNKILDLADTPPRYGTAGQVLAMKTTGDDTEWVDNAGGAGGGATTLKALTDTPTNILPNGLFRGNADGTATVWTDGSELNTGGGNIDINDLAAQIDQDAHDIDGARDLLAFYDASTSTNRKAPVNKVLKEAFEDFDSEVIVNDTDEILLLTGAVGSKIFKRTAYDHIVEDILGRSKLRRHADNLTYVLEGLTGNKKLDGNTLRNNLNSVEVANGVLTIYGTNGEGTQTTTTWNGLTGLSEDEANGLYLPADTDLFTQSDADGFYLPKIKPSEPDIDYDRVFNKPEEHEHEDDEIGNAYTIPASFVLQDATGDDAGTGAAVGSTQEKIIALEQVADGDDLAHLGLEDQTGRIKFDLVHTNQDTLVAINGSLKLAHAGLGGLLELKIRGYDATNTALGNDETLSSHPVAARLTSAGDVTFDLPITESTYNVRKGNTYELYFVFTPVAASNPGYGTTGVIKLKGSLADDANLISFRRVRAADDTTLSRDQIRAITDPIYRDKNVKIQKVDLAENVIEDELPIREGEVYDVLQDAGNELTWRNAGFTTVGSLPSVTGLTQGTKFYLEHQSGPYLPGGYIVAANPDTHKNRAIFTIESNSRASNVFGAQKTDTYSYGDVESEAIHFTNKIAYDVQTNAADYFQLYINEEEAGNRTYIRARINVGSAHQDFRFIRETQSAEDTYNNVRYRRYGANPSLTPSQKTFLATAIGEVSVDFFNDDGSDLNFKVESVWGRVNDVNFLKQELESNPIVSGLHALKDFNQIETFSALANATSEMGGDVLKKPGYIFGVISEENNMRKVQPYIVVPRKEATGGTKGADSRRSYIKLHLFENVGASNTSHYYDIQSNTGNKVNDFTGSSTSRPTLAQIDPDQILGGIFFHDGYNNVNGEIEVWLKQGTITQSQLRISIENRKQGIGSVVRPKYYETLMKATADTDGGASVDIRGTLYDRFILDTGSNTEDWEFLNDDIILGLATGVNGAGPININPDLVVFTQGTGFVGPTGAIAARTERFGQTEVLNIPDDSIEPKHLKNGPADKVLGTNSSGEPGWVEPEEGQNIGDATPTTAGIARLAQALETVDPSGLSVDDAIITNPYSVRVMITNYALSRANNAVGSNNIGDNQILERHYANESIDTTHIKRQNILGSRIATGGVGNRVLANGAVTNDKVANGTLTKSKFAAGELPSNTVDTLWSGTLFDESQTSRTVGFAGGKSILNNTYVRLIITFTVNSTTYQKDVNMIWASPSNGGIVEVYRVGNGYLRLQYAGLTTIRFDKKTNTTPGDRGGADVVVSNFNVSRIQRIS